LIFEHIQGQNRKIKDIASNVLVNFCLELSNYFSENQSSDYHKNLIEYIVRKLKRNIQEHEDRYL